MPDFTLGICSLTILSGKTALYVRWGGNCIIPRGKMAKYMRGNRNCIILRGKTALYTPMWGSRCSPEAAELCLGNNLGAECSTVEGKCLFWHKRGSKCSPEAAELCLGNNLEAECSTMGEKCLFWHKRGSRCSSEAAELCSGAHAMCVAGNKKGNTAMVLPYLCSN